MNALEVKNLSVSFSMYGKGTKKRQFEVISDLSLKLKEGEILAVAGSSGSGKSLLAHAILGILPKNASWGGEITWYGKPLTTALQKRLRGRELALVPQSVTYLDPIMRVGKQISRDKALVSSVLEQYELGGHVARLYPFELSGGMARRTLLATAAAAKAKVIIADEPTPGLSQELADAAMASFRELADKGAAVLLITHDIDTALNYADRIAVFYGGTTVETASAEDFKAGPKALRHPYTKALWQAIPSNGFQAIEGIQPYAGSLPEGCLFAPRCPMKTEGCTKRPPMRDLREGEVRCNHAD